jgi:hypothetical protein
MGMLPSMFPLGFQISLNYGIFIGLFKLIRRKNENEK